MKYLCHGRKCSEDQVWDERYSKYETTRWRKFRLENVVYVPQEFNNPVIVSRLVSKGDTMEATKENTTIKKNGARMNLNAKKGEMVAQCYTWGQKRLSQKVFHTNNRI